MEAETKTTVSGSLSRNLTLASVFAGLYAVLVVALAPISFLPFQIRFADALLPLAVIFGWPAALGLAIGAGVGNLVGDLLGGFFPSSSVGIDVIGGSLANLIACLVAWKIGATRTRMLAERVKWFVATIVETAVVSVIVGSYLGLILSLPLEVGIVGVLLGSIVAINIIGFLLLTTIARPRTLDRMRSWGMNLHTKEFKENQKQFRERSRQGP